MGKNLQFKPGDQVQFDPNTFPRVTDKYWRYDVVYTVIEDLDWDNESRISIVNSEGWADGWISKYFKHADPLHEIKQTIKKEIYGKAEIR
jgi:hypothetical protein